MTGSGEPTNCKGRLRANELREVFFDLDRGREREVPLLAAALQETRVVLVAAQPAQILGVVAALLEAEQAAVDFLEAARVLEKARVQRLELGAQEVDAVVLAEQVVRVDFDFLLLGLGQAGQPTACTCS